MMLCRLDRTVHQTNSGYRAHSYPHARRELARVPLLKLKFGREEFVGRRRSKGLQISFIYGGHVRVKVGLKNDRPGILNNASSSKAVILQRSVSSFAAVPQEIGAERTVPAVRKPVLLSSRKAQVPVQDSLATEALNGGL